MNNEIIDSKLARALAVIDVEDVLYTVIEWEIDHLEGYFITLEELIDKEERKELSSLEREAASPNVRTDFWVDSYPYYWEVFATQLRFSFVVWAIAVLERHVKRVCSSCAILAGKEWEEPDRGFIKNVSQFLVKQVGFSKPTKEQWDKLENTFEIRNYLVHQGVLVSNVDTKDNSRRAQTRAQRIRLLHETKGIEIKNYHLEITQDFCKSILSLMKELFAELRTEHTALCKRTIPE